MEQANSKGQWGSKFGFLMAAVGSAVGLGNLWGFPYKMGKSGGFAFLLIYLILVVLVGVVIMLAELALGRKTGKGVIYAYRSVSKKYTWVGWLGWLSPLLILGFYCMLGGYCIKYSVANIGDLFHASWGIGDADPAKYFGAFTSNMGQTCLFTLIFTILTIIIVNGGVSGGIEKFTTVAMPELFFMLLIVIIRSCTMPGAGAGLSFVFKPNFEVFKGAGWISVLATAGGQMFFSLSLGMGIMVTYGSYLKKDDNLEQSALLIPFFDTLIAVMAAMATMPATFASGLDPAAGPGMLFITLQTVFNAMGAVGPIFGFLFYFLVFIAAITSSISLLEAVGSTILDMKEGSGITRTKATLIAGIVVLIEGLFISCDGLGANGFPQIFGQGCWLDSFDLVSEGIMMPLGSLVCAIIFGWLKKGYVEEEVKLSSEFKMKGFFDFCMKFIVPIAMVLVLLGQLDGFFGLGIFS